MLATVVRTGVTWTTDAGVASASIACRPALSLHPSKGSTKVKPGGNCCSSLWLQTRLLLRSTSSTSGRGACWQCETRSPSRKWWPPTLIRQALCSRGSVRHIVVASMMSATCTMLTDFCPFIAPPELEYAARQVQTPRAPRGSAKMPDMVRTVAPRSCMYVSARARGVARSGVSSQTTCPGLSTR